MYRLIGKLMLWYLDHGPSRWQPSMVAVLKYVGPHSGRRIRLALMPMAIDGQWVVAVANHKRKSWWKAFRSPLAADLIITRVEHPVMGRLIAGEERDQWSQAYLNQFPRGKPRTEDDMLVVLFTPRVG